jgi:LmbE family N-acetylglucosaminyl deacetylase
MSELLLPVPEDWQRAVAIAAHPDDLEYGASSAVAKWTAAGKEVVYILASRGEAGIDALHPDECGSIREAEEREAGRLVGVDVVEFLGYRDGRIEHGLPLRRDLARALRRHRPEVVITVYFGLAWASGGLNQADHRAVGLAACDAARDAGNRWIFPELLAEGLEPWGGIRFVFISSTPEPTHACPIDAAALERGIGSLQAHGAYFGNLGRPFDIEGFLRRSCAETGQRAGSELAVGFGVYTV